MSKIFVFILIIMDLTGYWLGHAEVIYATPIVLILWCYNIGMMRPLNSWAKSKKTFDWFVVINLSISSVLVFFAALHLDMFLDLPGIWELPLSILVKGSMMQLVVMEVAKEYSDLQEEIRENDRSRNVATVGENNRRR